MFNIQHCREDGTTVQHTWNFSLLTMAVDAIGREMGDETAKDEKERVEFANEGLRALFSVGTFTFCHDITIVHPKPEQEKLEIKAGDFFQAWR